MRRPTSPFLLLLLGSTVTLLLAEWLRFQAGVALAALPLGTGMVLTLTAVGRAFGARRAWRARQDRLSEEAAHAEAARVAAATRRADELRAAERAGIGTAQRTPTSAVPALLEATDLVRHDAGSRPEPQLGTLRDDPTLNRSHGNRSEATRELGEAAVSFARNRSDAHPAASEEE